MSEERIFVDSCERPVDHSRMILPLRVVAAAALAAGAFVAAGNASELVPLRAGDFRGELPAILDYLGELDPEVYRDPRHFMPVDAVPNPKVSTLRSLLVGWYDIDGDGTSEMLLQDAIQRCDRYCRISILKRSGKGWTEIGVFSGYNSVSILSDAIEVAFPDRDRCPAAATTIEPRSSGYRTVFGVESGYHWSEGEWRYFVLPGDQSCG